MIKKTMPTYDIMISEDLHHLVRLLENTYTKKTLFIVTDQTVYKLYHTTVNHVLKNYTVHYVTLTPGEQSKSLTTFHDVIKQLINKGIKRDHFILALGGGVVGDLTGFVAATLYRGIRYAQVPTTLLAQVDSSVGSKVAIDCAEGKNLIGAFYDPVFVFIHPNFLKTLPKREFNNGIAEMIKAGLIQNKSLYQSLLNHAPIDETLILKAIHVKADLVLKDPYDHGDRMLLNFGHTFGHAIEKAHGYKTYKHGEAISYGMLIAIQIGIKLGITDQTLYAALKTLLLSYNLIKEPLLHSNDYLLDIKTDKKHLSDGYRFVVLKTIGEAVIVSLKEEEIQWM